MGWLICPDISCAWCRWVERTVGCEEHTQRSAYHAVVGPCVCGTLPDDDARTAVGTLGRHRITSEFDRTKLPPRTVGYRTKAGPRLYPRDNAVLCWMISSYARVDRTKLGPRTIRYHTI